MMRTTAVWILWPFLAASTIARWNTAEDGNTHPPRLQFAIQSEPKTLDPLLARDEPSEVIRYLTQASLVRLNRVTQTLEPELATAWKTSPQGNRIQVDLRTGVRFSDGSPFKASDVCATFRRMLDPKLESPLADAFQSNKGTLECRTEGDLKVTLVFPEARAGLDRLLDTVPIQPEKGSRAGLGPFVVVEHKAGAYLRLERNPYYWKRDARGRALPYLDSLRVEIQHNKDFEYLRFLKGEYQLLGNLDAELFEALLAKNPEEARDLGPSLDTEQIWFNQAARSPLPAHRKAWYASREFRQAVSLAIRREDLVRVVYRGHATPAFGPVSPANRAWHNASLKPRGSDPAAALALLRQAGFQFMGNTLRDAQGHPVEFSIVTNAGNKPRERMAAMIQQDLAAIGMRVTVAPLDMPSVLDRIGRSFNYDACLLGFIYSEPDPNEQLNVWLSSSSMHAWNPAQDKPATAWEAELDLLMSRQSTTLDPVRRKKDFDGVQRIVDEQRPIIYLVHRNALVALKRSVRNVQPSVLRPNLLWNIEQIDLGAGEQ